MRGEAHAHSLLCMVIILPIFQSTKQCVHALKGLALLRASHSGEIALVGSRRLRSTLVAAPVLFAHAIVTEIKIGRITSPTAVVEPQAMLSGR